MKKDLKKRDKLAEIIQSARVQKGYSQLELAQKADVSMSTINRIENSVFSPNVDVLVNICEALEINLQLNGIIV